MVDLVFKDQLEPLVIPESLEKWVLRVSKVCQALRVHVDLRETVDPLEEMVFQEMLDRLETMVFQESLVCQDLLVLLVTVELMELREMLDPLVLKASKAFQAPRDLLVSLVKRVF